MQAYGSLTLENNTQVVEAVLGRFSIPSACTSFFQLSAKEADPKLAMDHSKREETIRWFSLLGIEVGVSYSIPRSAT